MPGVRCFRERASRGVNLRIHALDAGIGSDANANSNFRDMTRANTTTIRYASRNFKRLLIIVQGGMPLQLSTFSSFISQKCNGRLQCQYQDYY